MVCHIRPALRRASPLIILLLMTFSSANGLLKEQAGKYDWLKQNIGDVKFARIQRDRIFVASRAGAIAALNPADGSIAWRVLLDKGQEATALETAGGVAIVLTSSGLLRAFGPQGQLQWEAFLPGTDVGCTGQAGLGIAPDGNTILVGCGEAVAAFSVKSGRRAWRSVLNGPSYGTSSVFVSESTATIASIPAR